CVDTLCSQEEYGRAVNLTQLFLEGRNDELVKTLRTRMLAAAERGRLEGGARGMGAEARRGRRSHPGVPGAQRPRRRTDRAGDRRGDRRIVLARRAGRWGSPRRGGS